MSASSSARPKVVVVGLSKTGTSTMRVMLEALGYTVCGPRKDLLREVRRGNMSAVDPVIDAHDAVEDWPWPLAYQHIYARYPDARFILTKRKSFEAWFRSLVNHGRGSSPFRGMYRNYGYYRPDGNEAAFRRIYEGHTAEVHAFFADKPGQLIDFCLETGDGWPELCGFLGIAVPDRQVPHINRTGARPKRVNAAINELIAPIYSRFRKQGAA
jgi:hypothetical protein